ncbi:MAG TPA: hypothetical protein VF681_14380 [Abditibacteriaceae bacterium]|jgi:hypothetical protein
MRRFFLLFLCALHAPLLPLAAQNRELSQRDAHLMAAPAGVPVSNGSSAEIAAIETALDEFNRRLAARDADTLSLLGLGAPRGPRALRTRISSASVTPNGALVRAQYAVWSAGGSGETPSIERSGLLDLWLDRKENGFAITRRNWAIAPDALDALASAAQEEWQLSFAPDAPALDAEAKAAHTGEILHLVAERRGGRWLALRRSRWDGVIVTGASLAKAERETGDARAWLRRQFARRRAETGAGVAHFVMQKGANGWAGLDSVFDPARSSSAEIDRTSARFRQSLDGATPTAAWLAASSHRDFATTLAQLGLYAEAADEAEKAEMLQPNIFGAARLRQFAQNRARDPLALAILQVQNESRIGIGWDHPVYVLNALAKKEGAQPTALGALQIGLEYSKLAQDARAASWLRYAQNLIANGALKSAAANDVQWAGILNDQLDERRRFAAYKPPNIIRSGIFTVRCWPGDLNTVQLLAGLESAQHTVYSDFGVPMGNTEVVLWRNQGEFQSYTGRASGQQTSEFIAALTLTKLVASQSGPVVLGEEVNVFADPRANTVGTIAHEYGHVAVRHVSHGRAVPTWFNEGIATTVEGGYDGYQERVRDAAERGALLSMAELQEWDVDGERAFLAYSQANSLVDFVATRWGRDQILEILRQIGRDVPPETAFRNVLKISTPELWKRWAAQIQ